MSRLTIAIQMDPLTAISFGTDSTILLAAAAERRGHTVYLYEPGSLSWQPGLLSAPARRIRGLNPPLTEHVLDDPVMLDLGNVDVILLRQDPPYDMAYIASTHLLELVSDRVLVVNDPRAVRDAPEKLLVQRYPDLIPPTLITRTRSEIDAFREAHRDIIIKPLFGHAGHGVFHLAAQDENYSSVLEQLLSRSPEPLIVQKYLPEVREGDRRIVLIDGEPVGIYARIPPAGESRANARAGGQPVPTTLTARESTICTMLAPYLKQNNLLFVGIDVIGGFLTEINVTSPTGLAALNRLYGGHHEDSFWPLVEKKAASLKQQAAA